MALFLPLFLFFLETIYKETFVTSHKIFHHTFIPNTIYEENFGEKKYTVCSDKNGFKIKCGSNNDYKKFDIAFIGDSMTEGKSTFEESFVGLIANEFPDLKIVNLGVQSYSPTIYLSKIRYYLKEGITFKRLIVYIDIGDIQDEAFYFTENGKVMYGSKRLNIIENVLETIRKKNVSLLIKQKFNKLFPETYKGLWVLKNLIIYQQRNEPRTEKNLVEDINHPRSAWTYNNKISVAYGKMGVEGAIKKTISQMDKLFKLTKQNGIKLSVAVYPWPAQILFYVENSRQVKIWKKFCENKCEFFINSFPSFFNISKEIGKQETVDQFFIKKDMHFNLAGNEILYLDFIKTFNKGY